MTSDSRLAGVEVAVVPDGQVSPRCGLVLPDILFPEGIVTAVVLWRVDSSGIGPLRFLRWHLLAWAHGQEARND